MFRYRRDTRSDPVQVLLLYREKAKHNTTKETAFIIGNSYEKMVSKDCAEGTDKSVIMY